MINIINMCTKFEVSSLSRSRDILGRLKTWNGSRDVTWPRPFHRQFVICRLGLAIFNPHTKIEKSTITCDEDMTGNAKCKNSRFEPPFGGLRCNAQGSFVARWKAHCWLSISDNWTFTLALTAAALLTEICRKRHFLKGWVTLSAHFGRWYVARNPSMDQGSNYRRGCRGFPRHWSLLSQALL